MDGGVILNSMDKRNIDLDEIQSLINVNYIGVSRRINSLNLSNRGSEFESILSYSTSQEYVKLALKNESVKALFVKQCDIEGLNLDNVDCSFFVVENPEREFYNLHEILEKKGFYGSHQLPDSEIGINCSIHSSAVIEEGVQIGNNVKIGPNCHIRKRSVIGDNVRIGANSIIGAEGFQALYDEEKPYLVTHVGGTKIGKCVSIGDNVSICNNLFEGYTSIGDYTKIDNSVHIGHNCFVGENCCIISGVVILGSVRVNNNVWIAPNSVLMNKIVVENNSFIGAASFVINNVKENTKVFGNPARVIGFVKE